MGHFSVDVHEKLVLTMYNDNYDWFGSLKKCRYEFCVTNIKTMNSSLTDGPGETTYLAIAS